MIERTLEPLIQNRLFQKKAIVVVGPRQVGKTTLFKRIVSGRAEPQIWLDGDDPHVRERLAGVGLSELKALIGNHQLMVIDEAQRIHNIGLTLKMITDHFPQVQLLVTGSSALDLSDEIKEPLTGRKFEFFMTPVSFAEMIQAHGEWTETPLLEHRLLYGLYPDVVMNPGEEREILTQLASDYLYKDVFNYETIKKPALLEKLLQALALQLGQEVVYRELAQLLGVDPVTVERYIDLLEKAFVVFRLPSLSRNARNEIKKGRKIYFYDTGIRNAIINNFSPIALRPDCGALWENFLISERQKNNQAHLRLSHRYFWRTHSQQEIDYIEERDGILHAFEFKWSAHRKIRFPSSFASSYPNSQVYPVTRENFIPFVTE